MILHYLKTQLIKVIKSYYDTDLCHVRNDWLLLRENISMDENSNT